jgi:thioredoxin type arsenate reductase
MTNKGNILFLCTQNSCRSQTAEAFARKYAPDTIEVRSAGTEPAAIHPVAISTLKEYGIDISGYKSKAISELDIDRFDLVVTLCDTAKRNCPVFPGAPNMVHWNLEDPAFFKGTEQELKEKFKQMAEIIKNLTYDLFNRGYLSSFIQQKRNIDTIFDCLPQGIIAHDLKRKIFFFSSGAEKITGFTQNEVLGKDCHEVFKPMLCGENCQCQNLESPTLSTPQNYQTVFRTKQGIRKDLDVNVVPLKDEKGEITGALASLVDKTRLTRLENQLRETTQFCGIVGQDHKMHMIYDLIKDVAESDASVVISGESGTGKELVANAIHSESPRRDKLFVPINCGALPEGTLESELFGHVRGAFTGAIRDKKGRFELADGGTIFLDEVGELSQSMQVKLLRVLQDGMFEPVGSETTVKVDVRVLSATNKNLKELVKKGGFREDLYYRLAVVPLDIPPLRARKNDIPLIANHFLKTIAEKSKGSGLAFSDQAMDVLMNFEWPGNVRQLQNAIQFAAIKCHDETIKPEHLPPEIVSALPATASLMESTTEDGAKKVGRKPKLDYNSVEKVLLKSGGNKAKASRMLGVGRATLYNFIRQHKELEKIAE